MTDAGLFFGGSCLCFVIVPATILIILSFATLEPVEYGLNFNAITMSLENTTYSVAGLYFLGFGHWFIVTPTLANPEHKLPLVAHGADSRCPAPSLSQRFPRTIQTIEFIAHSDNQLLHTRTSDGLPLTLGLSFQYRYIPEHLHTLYLTFRGEHQAVYVNTATATIANIACNYSAYTFFNDKQGIAISMMKALRQKFSSELYATVEALQISQVELPASFQDAILTSIATKQNITRSMRYKDNMQVTFQTQRMVSEQSANQTIITARGEANRNLLRAQANAKITEQTVQAEMDAYSNLNSALTLDSSESLNYIWWDTLQSAAAQPGAPSKEFLIGLDPAAYIKGK